MAKLREVFLVTPFRNDPSKSSWVKIGVAFVNKNGSESVKLDAVPTNMSREKDDGGSSIVIQDYVPKEEKGVDGFDD